MSVSSSGSRKKSRAKENKAPTTRERQRSSRVSRALLPTIEFDYSGVTSTLEAGYVCTGKFAVDFLQLCQRAAISDVPNIVARPHRPSVPASSTDGRRSTGSTSKQSSKSLTSDVAEIAVVEPPPRTYLLRDSTSFFRPTVQVEVDKADKSAMVDQSGAVTEVYIRGWEVNDVMMGILAECFPFVTSLHTVDLWNVGLNDVTLARLASVIPQCRTLRTLVLDANCVPSQRWHLLLEDDSPLQHLSLRYCGITSLGAKYLGQSLGCSTRQNTHLLSLNLAGNHVSDSGASFLADALRLNRSLLVLNLAGNGIGDMGAIQLAQVLSSFELRHDEVVERRRIHYAIASRLRAEAEARRVASKGTSNIGKVGVLAKSLHAVTSPRTGKRTASPPERTEHGKTLKPKAAKSPRTLTADDGKLKEKRSGTRLKKIGSSHSLRSIESTASSMALDQVMLPSAGPLFSAVVLRESTVANPTTLIRGNRSLISLNLSRNDIGHAGMTALLDAVLALSLYPVSADTAIPGLLRITVHNNARAVGRRKTEARSSMPGSSVATDDAYRDVDNTARHLAAVISTRDPQLRSTSAINTKPIVDIVIT